MATTGALDVVTHFCLGQPRQRQLTHVTDADELGQRRLKHVARHGVDIAVEADDDQPAAADVAHDVTEQQQ